MTWKCLDFLVLGFPKALLKYLHQPNSLCILVANLTIHAIYLFVLIRVPHFEFCFRFLWIHAAVSPKLSLVLPLRVFSGNMMDGELRHKWWHRMTTMTSKTSCISTICVVAFHTVRHLTSRQRTSTTTAASLELRTCSCCCDLRRDRFFQHPRQRLNLWHTPVIEHETPAQRTCPPDPLIVTETLDDTFASPATEYVAPELAGTETKPAPVIEHVSFAPMQHQLVLTPHLR